VKNFPLISFINFVLLGPIVEELTYRLGLFSFLKQRNRWVAYIVTVGLFAIIHFNFNQDNIINELLNLPFYATAGLYFCWLYEKQGFAVATIAHITNNLISFVSILLISEGLSS
jgi:membrane protease YdiL (CAAX protease family)